MKKIYFGFETQTNNKGNKVVVMTTECPYNVENSCHNVASIYCQLCQYNNRTFHDLTGHYVKCDYENYNSKSIWDNSERKEFIAKGA